MRSAVAFAIFLVAHAAVPSFPLLNAAAPGLTMPAVGLGTGAYSNDPSVGYGGYPECWSEQAGCGAWATQATSKWLEIGGRRIDAANSYQNQHAVGVGIAASGVARSDIFLLSKIGPSNPMGYQDAKDQFAAVLQNMSVTYVDALLVHWPWQSASQGNVSHNNSQTSKEAACNPGTGAYNMTLCRLDTWRALVEIWQAGGARSIGVSNYNATYLQEIVDAGMPLPALTQNPFHIYRSSSQLDTIEWCRNHSVFFLGYSPLGVPDWHTFPTPNATDPAGLPAANQLVDPVVLQIAAAHGRSPAQVLLAWQFQAGVGVNPRTMNGAHMQENLSFFDLVLTQAEMTQLWSRPQATCDIDGWYECAP